MTKNELLLRTKSGSTLQAAKCTEMIFVFLGKVLHFSPSMPQNDG
jgi:hypothetical protein